MDSLHTNHMWIVIDHMDGARKCKARTLAEAERREGELPMKILTRRNWKRRVQSLTPVSFFIVGFYCVIYRTHARITYFPAERRGHYNYDIVHLLSVSAKGKHDRIWAED